MTQQRMLFTSELPNFLILNPYSLGFYVFMKERSGQLQRLPLVHSKEQIYRTIDQLPTPRLVVCIDGADSDLLGKLILRHETELCSIPLAWISHLPLEQVEERARLATQIAEAYFLDPIRLFGIKDLSL